jgi:hypothetical protein
MMRRKDNSELIERLEALLVELKGREDEDLIPIPESSAMRSVVDAELERRLGGARAYGEIMASYHRRNPLEVDRERRQKK